jgi:hypothetical protein
MIMLIFLWVLWNRQQNTDNKRASKSVVGCLTVESLFFLCCAAWQPEADAHSGSAHGRTLAHRLHTSALRQNSNCLHKPPNNVHTCAPG